MATSRSLAERINDLQQRQAQLREQERVLKARKNTEERKADTHRKIMVGATVESVLGRPIEQEELPKLLRYLHDQENRGRYFSRAMNEECNQKLHDDGYDEDDNERSQI